ncbi:MAG: hypothetical protein JOZ65_15270 [Chloroflexi bacterium]|nr:hypothetical protein [Chloroflexota bacterium]
MTPSSGFARITLNTVRWLLPWIAVLCVSVTLTSAMGSALHGASTIDQSEVEAAPSTDDSTPATALEQSTTSLFDTADPCGPLPAGFRHPC